jgi:hypothetical protein
MAKFIDLSGKSFNRWTIIKYESKGFWLCKCICGTEKKVFAFNITHGISKSCGCYRDEKAASDNFIHGLSDTPIHKRWMDMHQRCENPNNSRYKDWGGRGITICPRWHRSNPNGFINYVSDIKNLGEKSDDSYTVDRIDNDGDYSPENIRWASKNEQRLNQRKHRLRTISYIGFTRSLKEWAKLLNTYPSNILYYIKRGKDFDWIYKHYKGSV